jgi:RNA polymerase sigma-70 factor (ECF subfamily)
VARAHAASEDDAREAVAEAWTVVLAKEDDLPDEARAHGWLLGVVRNVARARRRQAARRRELEQEHAPELARAAAAHQPPVEATLLAQQVWRAISALPELQRDVVVARLLDGMSTKVVAQAIQRTEGTVKTSLHRGLRRLRDEFGTTLEEALSATSSSPHDQEMS